MDKWGGHGLAWVTRHYLIRDVVHSAANDRTNLAAVLEKPGLLIPLDPSDDDHPPDPDPPDPSISSRRPADVWVPRGPSGGQEAWDFSITSAFRLGSPFRLIPRPFPVSLLRWGPVKNVFLSTASQCTQAGITFCPLVLEAVGGGWSDALRSVVAWIGSESKRSGPTDGSDASFKIAQRISCTLHRETRVRS